MRFDCHRLPGIDHVEDLAGQHEDDRSRGQPHCGRRLGVREHHRGEEEEGNGKKREGDAPQCRDGGQTMHPGEGGPQEHDPQHHPRAETHDGAVHEHRAAVRAQTAPCDGKERDAESGVRGEQEGVAHDPPPVGARSVDHQRCATGRGSRSDDDGSDDRTLDPVEEQGRGAAEHQHGTRHRDGCRPCIGGESGEPRQHGTRGGQEPCERSENLAHYLTFGRAGPTGVDIRSDGTTGGKTVSGLPFGSLRAR